MATDHRTDLPEIVRAYLERALPSGRAVPPQVRIRQQGQMWRAPGARALRFTATERFSTERVAFSWRARFPLFGPLALTVADGYAEGDGTLEVRALGVRLQRGRGPELTQGEALRYLAELPWVPHAIAINHELEWRRLDDGRVEVSTRVAGERPAVEIEFDEAGDIARVSSKMRKLEVGKAWVPTPWGGEFADYRVLGGIRLPTRAEVHWQLEGEPFVYWRGSVVGVEVVGEEFCGG